MNDAQREALTVLTEVWSLSPDVRLGQLMAHLGFLCEVHLGKGLGDVEDDELIAVLYRHRAELRARLEGTPNQCRSRAGPLFRYLGVPRCRRRRRRLRKCGEPHS